MKAHLDDSELRNLIVDLRGAPARVRRNGTKVMKRAARLVDEEMTRDARGHQGNWFGQPGTEFDTPLEKHVSHEMLSPWDAEIGIENKGAGKLAHIIVYGSVNNAPVYDHTAALRRSEPAILRMLAECVETSVLGDER